MGIILTSQKPGMRWMFKTDVGIALLTEKEKYDKRI